MTSSATAAALPGGNTVLVEIVDRVAWVTMNRPEKRNAINPALSFEMLDVFEALDSDERCGALVLTGAGEAYSSGMDLREYFRATDKLSYDERLKVMRKSAMAQWKRLQFYGKPTIAMVNGHAVGGGWGLTLVCDFRWAAARAEFWIPEVDLGVPLGVASTTRFVRLVGPARAKEIIMECRRYSAEEARALGLVHRVVPDDALGKEVRAFAERLAAKPFRPLAEVKARINAIARIGIPEVNAMTEGFLERG